MDPTALRGALLPTAVSTRQTQGIKVVRLRQRDLETGRLLNGALVPLKSPPFKTIPAASRAALSRLSPQHCKQRRVSRF